MGPHRSALLVLAVLSALALCCAAPALALAPAGDGWYWQLPQPQGQLLNSVTMPDGQRCLGRRQRRRDHALHGRRRELGRSRRPRPPIRWPTSPSPTPSTVAPWAGWAGTRTPCTTSRRSGRPVIAFTSDGGTTWQAAPAPGKRPLTGVSFVGQDGWAVGKHGTILHSSDGGATWVRQRSGVLRDLGAVTFTDAQHGFAAGSQGVFVKTVDGGLTWTRIKGSGEFFWFDCNSLAMDGAGTLWASMGARGMSGEFDRLACSADGGRHWRTVDMGWDYDIWDITARGARIVGVGPVDEGSASGTSRIVSSSDGGATWRSKVLGQNVELTGIAVGSDQALCAVGTGTVWSTDGGATWTALGLPVRSAGSLDFVSDTQGWATGSGSLEALFGPYGSGATNGSVLHTTDGATWQEQLSEPGRSFSASTSPMLSTGGSSARAAPIRYSADGGATWTKQASGTTAYLAQVDATGGGSAWAMGFDGRPAAAAKRR